MGYPRDSTQAPALYAISLLVVFLCVAALYESWTIPFVNLLMRPLGSVGAVMAVTLRKLPNDIYLHIRAPHHHGALDEERHPDHPVNQGSAAPGA